MNNTEDKHDEIFRHLSYICEVLNKAQIPHSIADGTLLGAVRENDILKTEERDFDIDICDKFAADVRLLNNKVKKDGYEIVDRTPGVYDEDIGYFFNDMQKERAPVGGAGFIVNYKGEFVGDIYVYTIFNDGFARRYCLEKEASVNAKMTMPAWFLEETTQVTIRNKKFHGPRFPEEILLKAYGQDWQTPIKPGDFGAGRHPDSGTVYDSDMERLTLLALENGWDANYSDCPSWPRDIAHVGSYAGRRWLVRHDIFLQLLDQDLFTEEEHLLARKLLDSNPSAHVRQTVLALIATRINMARLDEATRHKQEKKELADHIAEFDEMLIKIRADDAKQLNRKSVKLALFVASSSYNIRQKLRSFGRKRVK